MAAIGGILFLILAASVATKNRNRETVTSQIAFHSCVICANIWFAVSTIN